MKKIQNVFHIQDQNTKFTKEIEYILILPALIILFSLLRQENSLGILLIPIFLIFILFQIIINFIPQNNHFLVSRSFTKVREMEQGEIDVILEVINSSNFSSQFLELIDEVPNSFEIIEGTNVFLFNLPKRSKKIFQYKVKPKKIGIYEFGNIYLRHSDYFGFKVSTFKIKFENNEQIYIIPKFERLNRLPIYTKWLKFINGYVISQQFGQDSEFKGVKEYQNGDKLQNINWKVSSRYQATPRSGLYSNTFSFDNVVEFELVLDLSSESKIVFTEETRAIATITEYLIRTRNKVGLTLGKEYPLRLKGKEGTRQYHIILDTLLKIKPDEEQKPQLILSRLLNLSNHFQSRSIILMISPLIGDLMINYCREMKLKNYNIIVIRVEALKNQIKKIGEIDSFGKIFSQDPLFHYLFTLDLLRNMQIPFSKMISDNIPILSWNMDSPINGLFLKKRIVT